MFSITLQGSGFILERQAVLVNAIETVLIHTVQEFTPLFIIIGAQLQKFNGEEERQNWLYDSIRSHGNS